MKLLIRKYSLQNLASSTDKVVVKPLRDQTTTKKIYLLDMFRNNSIYSRVVGNIFLVLSLNGAAATLLNSQALAGGKASRWWRNRQLSRSLPAGALPDSREISRSASARALAELPASLRDYAIAEYLSLAAENVLDPMNMVNAARGRVNVQGDSNQSNRRAQQTRFLGTGGADANVLHMATMAMTSAVPQSLLIVSDVVTGRGHIPHGIAQNIFNIARLSPSNADLPSSDVMPPVRIVSVDVDNLIRGYKRGEAPSDPKAESAVDAVQARVRAMMAEVAMHNANPAKREKIYLYFQNLGRLIGSSSEANQNSRPEFIVGNEIIRTLESQDPSRRAYIVGDLDTASAERLRARLPSGSPYVTRVNVNEPDLNQSKFLLQQHAHDIEESFLRRGIAMRFSPSAIDAAYNSSQSVTVSGVTSRVDRAAMLLQRAADSAYVSHQEGPRELKRKTLELAQVNTTIHLMVESPEFQARLRANPSYTTPQLTRLLAKQEELSRSVTQLSNEWYEFQQNRNTNASALVHHAYDSNGEMIINQRTVGDAVELSVGAGTGEILSTSMEERVFNLENRMRQTVQGQDHALTTIADSIVANHLGMQARPGKPVVILMVGPSGVGKTETAKAIAQNLFGSSADPYMKRFDMTEFKEEHSFAKLIGSPPGYVSSEAGGALTNHGLQQGASVVLFDEIEKAHPKILEGLMAILDEGRATDGQGRVVDMSKHHFFLTSNIGYEHLERIAIAQAAGDEAAVQFHKRAFDAEMRARLPGFISGRINAMVVYNSLEPRILSSIALSNFRQLADALEAKGIDLIIDNVPYSELKRRGNGADFTDNRVLSLIAETFNDPREGVRGIQKGVDMISQRFVGPIARHERTSADDITTVGRHGVVSLTVDHQNNLHWNYRPSDRAERAKGSAPADIAHGVIPTGERLAEMQENRARMQQEALAAARTSGAQERAGVRVDAASSNNVSPAVPERRAEVPGSASQNVSATQHGTRPTHPNSGAGDASVIVNLDEGDMLLDDGGAAGFANCVSDAISPKPR